MLHSPFGAAFTPGARFAQLAGEPIEVRTRVVGELRVPRGRICASDPLTTAFDCPNIPLAGQAPAGVFPVEVAVARFESDERVACARVRFGPAEQRAATWRPAQLEGDGLEDDELHGYGVDAGMGCFFDPSARADMDEATSAQWLAAIEENYVNTWSWYVAEVGEANVVMFSSGWGDGIYSSFWGLDEQGDLVELVTDFQVLIGPASESFDLPLPLPHGRVSHPLLDEHGVTLKGTRSGTCAIVGGKGAARVELTDGSAVQMKKRFGKRRYTWTEPSPDARLRVRVMVGIGPLTPL